MTRVVAGVLGSIGLLVMLCSFLFGRARPWFFAVGQQSSPSDIANAAMSLVAFLGGAVVLLIALLIGAVHEVRDRLPERPK